MFPGDSEHSEVEGKWSSTHPGKMPAPCRAILQGDVASATCESAGISLRKLKVFLDFYFSFLVSLFGLLILC